MNRNLRCAELWHRLVALWFTDMRVCVFLDREFYVMDFGLHASTVLVIG
ncbi:hypothetical protein KC19_3G161000 [Ceratodon purpureus]|uniref:Uncharacterized protein n=1 Tax=Ceratodon purpureus TaxID=3225 RepID=A0A8T0IMH5_CERPU|nr:hypothetical protein KC19_3G161000 [Ceratodon purpureus]